MGVGFTAEDRLAPGAGAGAVGFPGLPGKGLEKPLGELGCVPGERAPASLPGSSPVSWPLWWTTLISP